MVGEGTSGKWLLSFLAVGTLEEVYTVILSRVQGSSILCVSATGVLYGTGTVVD